MLLPTRLVLLHDPGFVPLQLAGPDFAGCDIQGCQTMRALPAVLRGHAPQAVVVQAPSARMARRIARVRSATSQHVLLAMLPPSAEPRTRIAAMEAGADACCDTQTPCSELAAIVRAIRRRTLAAQQSAMSATSWRLVGERLLMGPAGQCLVLTRGESSLMQGLLEAPDGRLPRSVAHPRILDVAVARLRAKAQRQGIALPLYSVRNWGYVFLPADEAA